MDPEHCVLKNIILCPLSALAGSSGVDRHRFGRFRCRSGSKFLCWCYSDPDSDWHQHDANPHADPTQVSHVLEIRFFFSFSNSFASLHCLVGLISVKDVIILSTVF